MFGQGVEGARWQNYILLYTLLYEFFIVSEFYIIADFTVEQAGVVHTDGHVPEIHNPWLVTALFVLFLGMKAGFFHLKIRYFVMASLVDVLALMTSFGRM